MGNGHGWKASFAKAGVSGSNPAGGTQVFAAQKRLSGLVGSPRAICVPVSEIAEAFNRIALDHG